MEVKVHERGPLTGKVNVRYTLDTLAVGESWQIGDGTVKAGYARNICSDLGRLSGKTFSVAFRPKTAGEVVTITRLS